MTRTRSPGAGAAIPASHVDLLERPLLAALTTLLPDGQPQTQPVWFDADGQRLLVNTMRGFAKERNMRRDPRVTLLVVDPDVGTHWVEARGLAALSTILPGGHSQTQPVWYSFDGIDVLIHTVAEGRKGRNMLADPRATVLIVDPDDTSRWIEIRGDVEITTDHALERLDQLTRAYTAFPCYYGHLRSPARRVVETRIVGRILPRRVVCDAIHR